MPSERDEGQPPPEQQPEPPDPAANPPDRWPDLGENEPDVGTLIGRGCAIVFLALVAALVLGFIQNFPYGEH